jgi:hypothetical protein
MPGLPQDPIGIRWSSLVNVLVSGLSFYFEGGWKIAPQRLKSHQTVFIPEFPLQFIRIVQSLPVSCCDPIPHSGLVIFFGQKVRPGQLGPKVQVSEDERVVSRLRNVV